MLSSKIKINQMRRRNKRRRQLKQVARGIAFAFAMLIISHSMFAFVDVGESSPSLSGKMEYAIISEIGKAISDNGENEYSVSSKYAVGDSIIVTHMLNNTISIKPSTYQVKQGDTLWDIAKSYCSTEIDIRKYIHEIRRINDIMDIIQVGTVLQMPIL